MCGEGYHPHQHIGEAEGEGKTGGEALDGVGDGVREGVLKNDARKGAEGKQSRLQKGRRGKGKVDASKDMEGLCLRSCRGG